MSSSPFKAISALVLIVVLAGLIGRATAPAGGDRQAPTPYLQAHEDIGLPEVPGFFLAGMDGENSADDASVSRNLFHYTSQGINHPKSDIQQVSADRPSLPQVRKPPEPTRCPLVPTRPKRSRVPEMLLTYMGYVGPMNERVAVLLDPDGKIVVGKEGEVIQEDFRILRIGFTYLEMGYVEFEGSKPLPLGGKAGVRQS